MLISESNTLLSARRPGAIIGMLLVSLLLIGILGWQSYRVQQSSEARAESVLREYAILVADELGRRLTVALGYRGYFQLISRFDDPNSADEMLSTITGDERSAKVAKLAGGFFVYDGKVLSTVNIDQTAELETLLRQLFSQPEQAGAPYQSARTASGDQQLIYVLPSADDETTKVFGFTVNTVQVAKVMQDTLELGPLLPSSLADGQVSNDLLFTEVSTPEGKILFASNRQYDSHLSVSKVLGDDYQGILDGFRIQVSVDPDSASSLLIGGLPESRLPWLLAVMLMAIILMVTAIWLFRREHAVMKLRSDFISQVSHELRTPLTQIRMFAETLLLERTRTEDESRRSLEIIDRESRRLSHLVENILLFSNISDASHFDRRWQALAPIVRAVCDTVQATAKRVTIRLSADESACANVDAHALHQVVLNLLDNAVKFGPQKQEISVAVDKVNSSVQISITDQGPGIPAAERERVWAAFYRLKREQDTAISGTGIGLSVVRELVEAMGGRCWFAAPAAGTRVIIEFSARENNG